MLNKLIRLANLLDKEGYSLVADEIDNIIRNAAPLTDEEIDKSVEEYFNNPEIQERNRIEREHGLDEDDMFGLEKDKWHGFKYSFEGVPKSMKSLAKPATRYQTVIPQEGEELVSVIKDPDGMWFLCGNDLRPAPVDIVDPPPVYMFKSNKDLQKEEEQAPFKAEVEKMLAEMPDEVEVAETPEDILEVEEAPKKPYGGGVKLF